MVLVPGLEKGNGEDASEKNQAHLGTRDPSSYPAASPPASHQPHKTVVLLILVGQIPDSADFFLPFSSILLLLSAFLLQLLLLLLLLPGVQLLLPERLLHC